MNKKNGAVEPTSRLPAEDAARVLAEDRAARIQACGEAIQAALTQYGCEPVPVLTIVGGRIESHVVRVVASTGDARG